MQIDNLEVDPGDVPNNQSPRDVIIERITEANFELDQRVNQLKHVVETSVKGILDQTDESQVKVQEMPPEILAKDKYLKKQMKIVFQQKKKKHELSSFI